VSRFKKLFGLGLVLMMGVTACNDANGPEDGFDPTASAEDLEAVGAAFETDVYKSLAAMGGDFSASAAPGYASEVVETSWDLISPDMPGRMQVAAQHMAELLNAGSAAVVLIPESFRGRTYEHDPLEGYVHNPEREGAPEDGIRFILYEVNPITGDPGQTEIGYVDVTDESTETAAIARLRVVSEEIEYVNYTVTATGVLNSISFNIAGHVTDGVTRVDIDLTNSVDATFASARLEVDYIIEVVARDFRIDANVVIEIDGETEQAEMTLDASFRQGSNTVLVDGTVDVDARTGTIEMAVNGNPFATITLTPSTITVVGPDGEALSAEHAEAVRKIIEALEEVFDDTFEDFFDPVEWLFDLS
jgi:hypothetical protein